MATQLKLTKEDMIRNLSIPNTIKTIKPKINDTTTHLTQEEREDLVHQNDLHFAEITSRVFVGQIFPNYKKLCLRLGQDVRKGCSKDAQLREWSTYFRWSKEGYSIKIEEVYSKPNFDNVFRSNEQHIRDSFELMSNYLMDNLDSWEQSPRYDTIYTAIIFNRDLAIQCGYIPDSFYTDIAKELANGTYLPDLITKQLQKYLLNQVKLTFRYVAKGIIASFAKKSNLSIDKVLVVYKDKQRLILSEDHYIKFKELEGLWVQQEYLGSYIAFLHNKDRDNFKAFLANSGFKYDNYYTGYKIIFSRVSLKNDLIKLREKTLSLMQGNNLYFRNNVKTKVKTDSTKVKDFGTDYRTKILPPEILEQIDQILEDFLSCICLYGEDVFNSDFTQ